MICARVFPSYFDPGASMLPRTPFRRPPQSRPDPALDGPRGLPRAAIEASPVVTADAVSDDAHMPPTVLVVDDHPAFRASARRLLERDGFEVVGEAGDASSAVELARRLQPDVVLLDVGLPDGSGLDVARRLRGSRSTVVLVSSRDPGDFGPAVQSSGAAGFIAKERLTAGDVRALWEGSA